MSLLSQPTFFPRAQRNPARAFSLSLLFWGAGQIYNRQRTLGLLLMLLMVLFSTSLVLLFIGWDSILAFLEPYEITRYELLIAGTILYLSGLILWILNALQAYYRAARTRTEPFQGVGHPWLVLLCALLIPGWGQFLNGQPKKGFFFLIFTAAGLASAPILLLVSVLWPMLQTAEERLFIEKALVVAVLLSPVAALMWLFNLYDAVKVSLDPIKREPLHKRIEYAINRIRLKGFARGVIPQLKVHLMLSLLLIFSVVVLYYYFPLKNYVPLLKTIESQLSERQMVFIPDLIRRFLESTFPEG